MNEITKPQPCLDRRGGTQATASKGSVRLEIWHDQRAPTEGPAVFWMSAGQAMGLVASLAAAAQRALKEQIS